ncbi:MAG: hypothetical protein A3C85_02455 [Candidatus Doudnabacteria bacterium RIFCSPHIGHO2_02_FULL_48_21]|uniref:histidine kinase n=1 Tax=Candidatus Doudnabacteria bacterium RIFCSPLOWO2_02_FULL_48_13 TaxID=1817845 RepID=A0A1F5QCK0_9BACT|nr:MAG: hypothetical protein A3K05_01510 [Candidatus Doudnabacteria bacterium RIFCSPHIGHO2_01_48_18]OGE79793.1 MAG: hypothetical protein A2668_02195 [Candidatus Doudnabacteria bacterium RIFCSPHIGHO2_01_FULL_48_180]OGE91532.1 MAG: hypothetical protein A3F44_02440 [Candidatus Doudnabacteria bacterium RIFCSPHIGHO2_12_FULL_47_25]OGE94000.1 MAG: hypothetical protein A3C85_02455 [Candidatus Doudnabacteria bacterium RIFCSPHIGHO2_02_FULL_48_21]OGE98026.1 MAG: hypothetical protein A3A83_02620 [Candidatu
MKKENVYSVLGGLLAVSALLAWLVLSSIPGWTEDAAVIGFAAVAFVLGVIAVLAVTASNARLKDLNQRLHELLGENYEVGKILVRRDMELTDANTRLIALDQSKSEFVSIAAHQLRTPLTGIRWTFNALLDREFGEINPEQYKVVESGLKSSVRMIDLVNDLLNVARIEEGKFGLKVRKQSFLKFLVPLLDRAKRDAGEKGVTVTAKLSPALPLVNLDEEKMGIALDNIVDNAIKYTPPGGKIAIEASPAPGGLQMIVSDTGIGIPKEQIHHIFYKFFRADNALRFQTSGNGLGLYVVKNIIEGHGGTVSLQSEEQKGTTVTITIPGAEK